MRLPRDLSARDLIRALRVFGYEISHQTGSHIRLTTQQSGEHHLTVPAHSPVKIGTLSSILRSVGEHTDLERDELLRRLRL